jgi:predicted RNase H-like HicB family nuclease
MPLTVQFQPAEEGGYTVRIKEVPGVISEGETKEEALQNVLDALLTCLAWDAEQRLQAGRERPVSETVSELEIA